MTLPGSALNEPNFEYNKNGDFTITRWYSGYIDHPQKGFVNKYSMTKPGEDKAEIYAALMRPDQAKTVDGWARSDEILARKIRYIRKFSLMASKPRGTALGLTQTQIHRNNLYENTHKRNMDGSTAKAGDSFYSR